MRKFNLSFIFMIGFLSLFIFSGCKNFLNGSELKTNIEKQIDYNLAKKVKIYITPDSADFGSTSISYFEAVSGDSLNITFQENETNVEGDEGNIIFNKWLCKDSKGTIIEDAVNFSDEKSGSIYGYTTHTITAKLITDKYDVIKIIPSCYKKTENIPPVVTDIQLFKTSSKTENVKIEKLTDTVENLVKELESKLGEDKSGIQNVGNPLFKQIATERLFIQISGYDEGSGLYGIRVDERAGEIYRTKTYDSVKFNPISTVDETGTNMIYSATVEHIFLIPVEDKLVDVSIYLIDNSGNEKLAHKYEVNKRFRN